MPNTDLTDTTNSVVPEEPKKSNAASRILRAVEKSRGDTTARLQIPAALPDPSRPVLEAPSPSSTPEPLPKLVMPKIGIDAREALRSLSQQGSLERGGIPKQEIPVSNPAVPEALVAEVPAKPVVAASPSQATVAEVPMKDRTVSEILRETKPAVTSPLPGEIKPEPVAPAGPAAPMVEAKPAAKETNRKEGGSKSGRHAKVAAKVAAAQAKSASAAAAPAPAPAPTAKPAPEEKKPAAMQEPVATPGRSANPAFEAPLLGMGPNPSQSPWANMPLVVKAGIGVLVLGLVAGVLFKFSGNPTAPKSGVQQSAKSTRVAVPMSGIGGWSANWGDPAKMNGRSISLFRPSLQHSDYRIEFEAQIEAKAFGWVFRAKDPQNYYAYKIETVKPGLQPLVALARITVVAGVESQKHYTLIESPVRPDTAFRISMDSVGSEFTTRVNDQLIEVWQDDRLRFGGIGLFSDPGERAQVRKVQISEMR